MEVKRNAVCVLLWCKTITYISVSVRSIQTRSFIPMGGILSGTPRQGSPFPVTWSAMLGWCPVRLALEMRHLSLHSTLWPLLVRCGYLCVCVCVLFCSSVYRDTASVVMYTHTLHRMNRCGKRVSGLRRTIGHRLTAASSLPFPQDTRSMTSPWPRHKWGCLSGSGWCWAALPTPSSTWALSSTGLTPVRGWSVSEGFLLFFCDG